jgi:hypothetical protein
VDTYSGMRTPALACSPHTEGEKKRDQPMHAYIGIMHAYQIKHTRNSLNVQTKTDKRQKDMQYFKAMHRMVGEFGKQEYLLASS